MSEKELKRLYTRSAYLFIWGKLKFYALIILTIAFAATGVGINEYMKKSETEVNSVRFFVIYFLVWLPFAIGVFSSGYAFAYVRNKFARVYFCFSSISMMLSILLAMGMMFYNQTEFGASLFAKVIAWFILLFIQIEIFRSAREDALFGADGFTHKQIAFAKKKIKAGETFVDEDIPAKRPNRIFGSICVALAFIYEILLILVFLA